MWLGHTENQYHLSLYDLSMQNVYIYALLFIRTYVLILERADKNAVSLVWSEMALLMNS